MREFFEPNINVSSPENHNTMGVLLSLKNKVDGEILWEVANELRERFPYFYVKVETKGGEFIPVDNDLPMTVRNTWDPINFNSEESNYHLAAWKYEDKRVGFEISHALTDGAGVMPYIKSAMYLYLSKVTGKKFEPSGFRLPGDMIPESETGNPFKDMDVDKVEAPFYQKKHITDFFRLIDDEDHKKTVFYLKLPEAQVMQYCRDFDGSPNVFFSVMLARAARRYDPDNEKTVTVSVCIDHKSVLGASDNYHMFVGDCRLDFPKNRDLSDISRVCTIARGQMMLQVQPENSLFEIKQMKKMLPPPSPDISVASICISYVNSRSFGPLDPYIEGIYNVTSLSKITDVLCEVTCINHNFFLAFMQPFSSYEYFDCFLKELDVVGINYEGPCSEDLRMCGIEK